MSTASIVVVCLFAVFSIVSFLFSYLLFKQNGRILIRLEAIERDLVAERFGQISQQRAAQQETHDDEHQADPSGTVAPEFTLPRIDGRGSLSLSAYLGRPHILIFTSSGCAPCDVLVRRLSQLSQKSVEKQILIVARGSVESYRRTLAEMELRAPVVVQSGWQISRLYGTFDLPSAYSLDEEGQLTSGVVRGSEAILGVACDVLYQGHQQEVANLLLVDSEV